MPLPQARPLESVWPVYTIPERETDFKLEEEAVDEEANDDKDDDEKDEDDDDDDFASSIGFVNCPFLKIPYKSSPFLILTRHLQLLAFT